VGCGGFDLGELVVDVDVVVVWIGDDCVDFVVD